MVRKIFDIIMEYPVYRDRSDSGTQPLLISILCLVFVCGVTLKVFFDRYSSVVHHCCILLLFFGAGRIYLRYFRSDVEIFHPSTIAPPLLFKIVLPILIYASILRLANIKFLDIHHLPRVLGISSFIYITYFSLLFGIVIGVFELCFDWKIRSLVVICFCLNLYQPDLTLAVLQSHGGHVKYLQALLKGEILVDASMSFIVSDIVYRTRSPSFYLQENVYAQSTIVAIVQFSGIFIGIVYALISQLLYSFVSSDSKVSSLISFPLVYIVYSSSELAGSSGCAAVCTFGIVTTVFLRPNIQKSDEKFISILWDIAHFGTTMYLTSLLGFTIGAVDRNYDIRMLCYGFGLFITTTIMRAFYCFLLLPYIYGKGQTKWKEVGLAVIGPYRGTLAVVIALRFATEDTDESHQILIMVVIVVYLSLFFNVIVLDWFLKRLNIFQLSKPQISTMNLAVERINKCRAHMIFAEKLDRIVADANWSVVFSITDFPHPYKDRIDSKESLDVFKEEVKTVECPKCGAWSIAPPTKKEMDEIIREAKLSVLKSQEVSYLKQRETGTLSSQGYKFLSNIVYQASYSETISVDTDDLRIAAEDMKMVKSAESFFKKINLLTMDAYDYIPKNHFRLKCYQLTTSQSFKIFMAVSSLIDMVLCLLLLYFYAKGRQPDGSWPTILRYYGGCITLTLPLFYLSNVLESIIQLCGLGVVQFFSKRAFMIEFFSGVVSRSLQVCLFFHQSAKEEKLLNLLDCDSIVIYLCLLMCFRISRVYIFVVSVIPSILRRLEKSVHRNLLKKYDIGKAYLVGLDRALKYSGQFSNNEKILEDIRKEVEGNRQKVSKEMGLIHKDHPIIAITVKTKHAIRHVINAMRACAVGLLDEGILDHIEYSSLNKPIEKLLTKLRKLEVIVPPSPINIMREISWLVGDKENTELFLDDVQMSNYDYNDVLIRNGDDPIGLYILVSGLLKATYVPSSTSIQLAAKFGVLPNYDFFENFKFDQPQEDYIVSGNVIGELGAVCGRRYDMTVTAETAVQVFFVSWEVVKSLHETLAGQRLLERIWKTIAVKISMTLLQFTVTYRHWTKERLLNFLQKGILPNLQGVVALQLDNSIEEAILIEGVAMDVSSQTIIYGPYRIPKTISRVWLPEHRSWDFQTVYPPKVFFILSSGSSIDDIVETEYGLNDSRLTVEGGAIRKPKTTARKVGFFQEELDSD